MGDRSGSAQLRVLFEPALQAYEEMTGIRLAEHPLAAQFQSFQSIQSITALVQDQVSAFSEYREKDRIVKSVESTMAVLTTLSATASFGDVIGLVRQKCIGGMLSTSDHSLQPFPPVKAICAGLAILLSVCALLCAYPRNTHMFQAAKSMSASYGALVDFLESTKHFLQHLDIYSQIRSTPVLDEIVIKIMVDLLSTLALFTKELKQGLSSGSVLADMSPR
jgi:hypothetical protein